MVKSECPRDCHGDAFLHCSAMISSINSKGQSRVPDPNCSVRGVANKLILVYRKCDIIVVLLCNICVEDPSLFFLSWSYKLLPYGQLAT